MENVGELSVLSNLLSSYTHQIFNQQRQLVIPLCIFSHFSLQSFIHFIPLNHSLFVFDKHHNFNGKFQSHNFLRIQETENRPYFKAVGYLDSVKHKHTHQMYAMLECLKMVSVLCQ